MAGTGHADPVRREVLLRAHDDDLRTRAEVAGADRYERIGPL